MKRTVIAGIAAALALVSTAACSSSGGGKSATAGGQELKGQTLSVAAVWTGVEQANFKKVLDDFAARTGATVDYVSTGDNLSTVVGSKIAGGDAPDVAMVPQLGVLQQFAAKGWLQPLSAKARKAASENFAPIWQTYGSVKGVQYGLYFKAADKSTVWYSPKALSDAGVKPPTTYDEMLKAAKAVSDSGLAGFSVAGEAGWPLTDWFENIYLSQAGPEQYDKLAKHEIPWTDPSVVKALATFGRLISGPGLVAGGGNGALQTDFPESVQQVFGDNPKAGLVYEGDFVGGLVTDQLKKKLGEDARFFPFPSVDGGELPVVGGGDAAVVLKAGRHQQAAMRFLEYLATPEAATVWAKAGGYISPNRAVYAGDYPDDTTRQTAQALVQAGDNVRFDMSDQAPAAFGGTQGSGEWKILQDFLKTPADAQGTARKLEAAATAAYKG